MIAGPTEPFSGRPVIKGAIQRPENGENRPLERTLLREAGFPVLSEAEIGPGLLAVRDEETAHGLDPTLRVCMSATLRR